MGLRPVGGYIHEDDDYLAGYHIKDARYPVISAGSIWRKVCHGRPS